MSDLTGIEVVLAKAALLCIPTASETKKITAVAEKVKKAVEDSAPSEVSEVLYGGSFAKGTWLRGDADIDVFIRIKPEVSEEQFEQLGVDVGKAALKKYKPHLRYSDHPYVEAVVDGIKVNVVPCYDVEKGKWKSAADRSPFHTLYMQKLDEEKRNQVRLLKRFFKATGTYGAEISTSGFSGYVSEVLVSKFGSFEGVIRALSDLRQGQVISVDDNYDTDLVQEFQSAVVIIDPVDPRRNLGTAISNENVGKFVMICRSFLDRPSMQFFRPIKRQNNKQLYENVLVAEFSHRKRSPDTIWGQLKRSLNSATKQLELSGFVVFRASCITDEDSSAAFAFLLESQNLPKVTLRRGPDIFRRSDASSFVKRARKPLVMWVDKEMKISTLVERKHTSAEKLVKSMLQDSPEKSGIAKDMITGKIKVYSGRELKKAKYLAREAADELVCTERLVFF